MATAIRCGIILRSAEKGETEIGAVVVPPCHQWTAVDGMDGGPAIISVAHCGERDGVPDITIILWTDDAKPTKPSRPWWRFW